MRARRIVLGLLFSLPFAGASGHAAETPDPKADLAFAHLAALVGEWRTEDGKEALVYELTAGGTALLERETAEGRPAMITLYHRDRDRLMLTHYCMAGNQPRMVARPFDPANGELVFEFLDATNLPRPDAGHMRTVKIRFVDANHLESEWEFHQDGKPSMTVRARYARVR
jgi:hypothetical protein